MSSVTDSLDRATCDHLLAWCEHTFRNYTEASFALETFVNSMSEDERAYALDKGWPFVAHAYSASNPEHFACFNE